MKKFILLMLIVLPLLGCSDKVTEGTMEEANALFDSEKFDDAASIYRYLANEKQNRKAMYNLGVIYYDGDQDDRQKAYNWFLKAANAGYAKAYPVLGLMNINGTNEKDSDGNDMVWLKCHKAIVTCDGHVYAAIWWYAKAVASGNKESIDDIMFAYNSESDKRYAWGMLAINQGIDITYYKADMDSFKKRASQEALQRAEEWGKELISLYGSK